MQQRLYDAVVKFGRPAGNGDNKVQYRTELAKILRSQFSQKVLRAEAADPASTTTNGNNYTIHPQFMSELIRQEDAGRPVHGSLRGTLHPDCGMQHG